MGHKAGFHSVTLGADGHCWRLEATYFTHKVPGCLRHLINIKGNGRLRLSLGNLRFR